MGQTKVLASITLQPKVPPFLRGKKVGWLTAEYAMLPCATKQRTNRESSQSNRNARSVEISRLIGRCLRTTVDLEKLGEKTIIVDCDVLQADGGTRVACITAASIALKRAIDYWHRLDIIPENIFKEQIAALSGGLVNNNVYIDLTYEEDSTAQSDFNFVVARSGNLIEVQGTAEKTPVSWDAFEILRKKVVVGIDDIFKSCDTYYDSKINNLRSKNTKASLFSLASRIGK